MQMPIITSCYWNMIHGTKPEEVKQDKNRIINYEYYGKKFGMGLEM